MGPRVELSRINKSFPGVLALQDVDLVLRAGSIHALVGENGAGKSTLINILSGILPHGHGEVRVDGKPVRFANAHDAHRLGVVTVHQEVDLFPTLTVAENIGLEQGLPTRGPGWIDWGKQRQRTREALARVDADLSPSVLAGTLSPAHRQLIEIAAALAQSCRVLILDEPTSSLSVREAELLFDQLKKLRAEGAAIMYVSHRLEEIFALADEVTVLRDGRRVWTGPIDETSTGRLIQLMVGREVMPVSHRSDRQFGPVRLRCDGLSAADGACADVTLAVRGGEVLGLYGLVGAGRSEWAQTLFGLRPAAGGEIRVDGQQVTPQGPGFMAARGLAYVPEDRLRDGLCRGLPVRSNAVLASLRQLARGLWLSRLREVRQTGSVVKRLGVRLRSIEQPVGTLSGGNQQKVVLGRWLARDPSVLLLDEPTRGVDVGAKAEIYALIHRLVEEGRAVVFISSDLPEVLAQSDRVAVFREGRLVATFDPRTASAEEVAAAAMPVSSAGAAVEGKKRERADEVTPGAGVGPATAAPRAGAGTWLLPSLREAALLLILVALFGFLQVRTGKFLQMGNLRGLAVETALLGFCAVGATLVILVGGLDISLGPLMTLSAGIAGGLWEAGASWPIVMAVAILLGGAGGLLNAGLSLLGRVHPIVVTLATMSLFRGLTLWRLKQDVQIPDSSRQPLLVTLAGFPLIAWLGLAVVLAVWAVLNWTIPGREVYAVGSNPAAARRVGISRARVWLWAFSFQGMLAGLSGFLYLASSGSLQPATSFDNVTLEAIAAAVVGGVAITGGRGSVWGAVLGSLFLVALGPACIFLHISTHLQRTLVGGVMVAAVLVDAWWRRRAE